MCRHFCSCWGLMVSFTVNMRSLDVFFFDSQSGRVYFDVKFDAIVVRLRTEVLFPSRNASGKGVGKHKGHLIHFIAASQEHHSVHTSWSCRDVCLRVKKKGVTVAWAFVPFIIVINCIIYLIRFAKMKKRSEQQTDFRSTLREVKKDKFGLEGLKADNKSVLAFFYYHVKISLNFHFFKGQQASHWCWRCFGWWRMNLQRLI